ncbi:MAG: CoA transferase [Clostridiales Family XIII bacterium]|jgi:crotonobetainyl-CoA:carnitine CoA-transferase CaiB-like acyl-CoA transferase|nr:CoA transferase [Clostridiales Family XIII bacterium]
MVKGPLNGVKVIEYCSFVAGPNCTKYFSDVGAEVIKIETPEGDEARRRGPFLGDDPNPELSGLFLYNNTNKLGVTLNLESPSGRDIFKKLIADADILVEDQAPGAMQRMGLDYEALKQVNPGLIMASITPFGQDGPYRDYKAYYLNTFHASGAGYLLPAGSPNADREPVKGGGYLGEYDIGACAAFGILGAYYWRRYAGGTGQHIDISKQEAEMTIERQNLIRYYEYGKSVTRVKANLVRDTHDTMLRCRDGGYIKVVLNPGKMWDGVCKALGNPDWTKQEIFSDSNLRVENFDQLNASLCEEALKYDTEDLFLRIQAEGTACAPVCSAEQVFRSPQLKARDFFVEIDHPRAGKHLYPGLPYKVKNAPPQGNAGAPLLGQHNEEVYGGRLGYSEQELARLKETGVI